jgi:hypothetical protein
MNEFEDDIAIINMVSKVIRPCSNPVSPMVQNSYKYLVEKHLLTPYDMQRLKQRVRDIYCDRLLVNEDEPGYIPDAYEIADFINEENMEIIRDFYKNYMYSCDEIENIIGNYIHNVGYGMEDWVMQALMEDGMAFSRGLSELSLKPSKESLDAQYSPQNIMFYEFLY